MAMASRSLASSNGSEVCQNGILTGAEHGGHQQLLCSLNPNPASFLLQLKFCNHKLGTPKCTPIGLSRCKRSRVCAIGGKRVTREARSYTQN